MQMKMISSILFMVGCSVSDVGSFTEEPDLERHTGSITSTDAGTTTQTQADIVLTLSGWAYFTDVSSTSTSNPVATTVTGPGEYYLAVPLHTGNELKQVLFSVSGNNVSDLTSIQVIKTFSGSDTTLYSNKVDNITTNWMDILLTIPTYELGAGEAISLKFTTNGSMSLGNTRITYTP